MIGCAPSEPPKHHDMPRQVEIKFEPRDIWVGLFWDRRDDGVWFWVCPLPCLVIIIRPRRAVQL